MLSSKWARRVTLLGLVGALPAGLALAGCAGGSTQANPPPARAPVPRVTITGLKDARTAPLALARATLAGAPIPPTARRVASLPVALSSGMSYAIPDVADAHHEYLLGGDSLGAFLTRHVPRGAALSGPDWGSGTGEPTRRWWSITMPTSDPHVSFDELDYVTTVAPNGETELRVDASVVWLPITRVPLPTTGQVRVTGFRELSLSGVVLGPTTEVLSRAQARGLAAAIASLPAASGKEMCMEDFPVFEIRATDRAGGPWVWLGTGDVCPGVLSVEGFGHSTFLLDGSCALDRAIAPLFPRGAATDTRRILADRLACSQPNLRG